MISTKELFIYNLKRYLKEHKLTQRDLAEKLHVSTATVSDWINGNKNPTFENIDKIANVLNISVADMFIDRAIGVHPDDKVTEERFLAFVRNKYDAMWIMKHMMNLSDVELGVYRTSLKSLERLKDSRMGDSEEV